MTKISFSRDVTFSAEQMLELVADVSRYPEFVPNCSNMEVSPSATNDNQVEARMSVKFGPVSGEYTSRVTVKRNESKILADAIDGPFSYLESTWTFKPQSIGSTITFDIDFAFSNPFIAAVAEPMFAAKQEEVIDAFVARARKVYASTV